MSKFIDNPWGATYIVSMETQLVLTISILGFIGLVLVLGLGIYIHFDNKRFSQEGKEMTIIAEQRVERIIKEMQAESQRSQQMALAILKEMGVKTWQIFERVDTPRQ